jgi:hypothetical protein
VDPEIQSPTAIHQERNVLNGTIWVVGAIGLGRHDRGAHKAIAAFQKVQSEECRLDGIIAVDSHQPCDPRVGPSVVPRCALPGLPHDSIRLTRALPYEYKYPVDHK